MPHFSYMVMAAPGSRLVHFGMKMAARRALPAWRIWLKNDCRLVVVSEVCLIVGGVKGRREGKEKGKDLFVMKEEKRKDQDRLPPSLSDSSCS